MVATFKIATLFSLAHARAPPGSATEVSSFTVPKSPSGMFYNAEQSLLYVLCGTATNADHYLYVYGMDGTEKCLITIPEAARMSRVDGFYIDGSTAFIVDSQGPIYKDTKLGGSVYAVDWTNPCGCDAQGACQSSTATWNPTVTETIALDATAQDIADGGGIDPHFRNSGIVVLQDHIFAVNGVHSDPSLTCCYPKSLLKLARADGSVAKKWSFTPHTLGHDFDMEGLTCGEDGCAQFIYIGDEYNFVYKLDLSESDPANAVVMEWDLNEITGAVRADGGIESIAFTDGKFAIGIQESQTIHLVTLSETAPPPSCSVAADVPLCDAVPATTQRIRRELRDLSSAEWQKVVDAIWVMKNTDTAAGQAQYGDAYKSYDYFVVQHAVNVEDSRGDQAHFSSAFPSWHGAFILEFERALLSVDASIGGLPYWDATYSVMTEEYFGSVTGTGDGNAVVDGQFANFPISAYNEADWASYSDHFQGATTSFAGKNGLIRKTATSTANVVARMGSEWTFPAACQRFCTEVSGCWFDWYDCVEGGAPAGGSFHGGAHGTLGAEGSDFVDPSTSPNDPIFWFHHANVDRNRMQWMANHQKEASVSYGYARQCGSRLSGNCPIGIDADDVAGALFPFAFSDLGIDGKTGHMTHADIVCHLGPWTAPYTYGPSLSDTDSSSCGDSGTSTGGVGGQRPTRGFCGDGVCDGPETAQSCSQDCKNEDEEQNGDDEHEAEDGERGAGAMDTTSNNSSVSSGARAVWLPSMTVAAFGAFLWQ